MYVGRIVSAFRSFISVFAVKQFSINFGPHHPTLMPWVFGTSSQNADQLAPQIVDKRPAFCYNLTMLSVVIFNSYWSPEDPLVKLIEAALLRYKTVFLIVYHEALDLITYDGSMFMCFIFLYFIYLRAFYGQVSVSLPVEEAHIDVDTMETLELELYGNDDMVME